MENDLCCCCADVGELEEVDHVPRVGRNRTSAGRRDDQAGAAVGSCSDFTPKKLARPDTTQRPSISAAVLQRQLNTSAVLMLGRAKKRKNVTVIVHCLSQTTCGESFVFWARKHQGYDGADGPRRMRAVEAMDNLHQDQASFLLMWPEVTSKHGRTQKKAMELNSYIVKATSKAESKRALAEGRAPL